MFALCLLVGLIEAWPALAVVNSKRHFPHCMARCPPVHAVHAAKRWRCKYPRYANPYSAWCRCIFLFSAVHSQPPGPSSPPMFHVSTCCSPTIANVEAAQFERSCTKQLIIHQSGSNAQVPLLDHVSVSHQPFNPQTSQPSAAYGRDRTRGHGTEARGPIAI